MEDNLQEKYTESRMFPTSYSSDDSIADMGGDVEDFN